MLTWPHQATDWQPYLREITETYIQMADAITRHEALVIATPHPIQVGALLGGRLSKEQMTNVFIYYCKTNDTWARDHGPITIKDRGEGKKTLLLNDIQLYKIRLPSFALERLPLTPCIAPCLGEDHPHVPSLRTNGLHMLLHEETTHRVLFRRIPRGKKKNFQFSIFNFQST